MQFLFYRKNGTYGTTNTNIRDILAEIQPNDIIDALDCVGIKVNRYFETMPENTDYVLWVCDPLTEIRKVFMKMYKNNEESDVEEFKISPDEVRAIADYFS